MDIQLVDNNPSCAIVTLKQAEYTFGYLFQHYLLEYNGNLGKVIYCGIQPFDENQDVISLHVEVAWAAKENQFQQLLKEIVQQIKSVFMELKKQYLTQQHLLMKS